MTIIRGGLIGGVGGGSQSTPMLSLADGISCYTAAFAGTSILVSHGLSTENVVLSLRDNSNTSVTPTSWSVVNPNTISVDFAVATTGSITVLGCVPSGSSSAIAGVSRVEGLSGIIDLFSPDGSVNISTSGQVILLTATGTFPAASGAVLEQKCRDIDTLSGLITAANAPTTSNLCFTPASGTEFTMEHGMISEEFVWSMWKNDVSPRRIIYPDNVAPSGTNHVTVTLCEPMFGCLNLSKV